MRIGEPKPVNVAVSRSVTPGKYGLNVSIKAAFGNDTVGVQREIKDQLYKVAADIKQEADSLEHALQAHRS